MLPHNAKIVIPNVKAIVFDDKAKCIHLWRNELAGTRLAWMHPSWTCTGRATNDAELLAFVTAEELGEDLSIAATWFWHDMYN